MSAPTKVEGSASVGFSFASSLIFQNQALENKRINTSLF